MIVVGNRVTQETFLKARSVIFRYQKYVKRVHRNDKKNLLWDFKKASWVALFPTTLRGRVSPRFLCIISLVERLSSELSYWVESHLKSCQTSMMKLPQQKKLTALRHWLFSLKSITADIKLPFGLRKDRVRMAYGLFFESSIIPIFL